MATKRSSTSSSETDEAETTVLFVDDEPEILEMYELLCRSNYTVYTAESGEAALEQFGDHIDIAFFDRRMPDTSGGELLRTVRAEGYETPVGIISAVDPGSGPDLDAEVYLTKPITRQELFDNINEHSE
jgi:DNA-binding response OmpR family regulator